MSFSGAINTDARGSTFNEVHGNQINITHIVTVVSDGQVIGQTSQIERIDLPRNEDTSSAQDIRAKVAAMLDAAVTRRRQKLEWRTSIVDLMKVLNLDSSYAARKRMALELCYTGDMDDSYSMNIWLHKQLMVQLMGKAAQEGTAVSSISC